MWRRDTEGVCAEAIEYAGVGSSVLA
jgi:hypothetical protein